MADTDMGFDFRDVGEIRVFSEVDSNSRFPGYTARYAPEIFALGRDQRQRHAVRVRLS
jgi:hypothetical protein